MLCTGSKKGVVLFAHGIELHFEGTFLRGIIF